MMEAEIRGVGPEAKEGWTHQKLEAIRMDSPLDCPAGAWPWAHLDFSLDSVALILHFWVPEPQENTSLLL